MDFRLDEIDRRILFELMRDARNTSATSIAEAVNVSPGTIRNRIHRLEEERVIQTYTAQVDFERADGHLRTLYVCNAPVDERQALAREASAIPSVIHVRQLMTGRRNLHITAVGENTEHLRRITRSISRLGIEIEDETLVESELYSPYADFGPDSEISKSETTDFISLAGDANILDVTVASDAPVVDRTLEDAVADEILDEDSLVIAIERGDRVFTPKGTTVIQSDDIVTILSRSGETGQVLEAFEATEAT